MSYILDALRRADAERDRGAVPGIHAQQVPQPPSGTPRGTSPWAWMAGGAGLLLVSLFAWQWMVGDEEPSPAPVASLPPPEPVPQAASVPRAAPTISLPPIVVPEVPRPRPAPVASAPTVPVRVPTLQELPDNIRRQIPAMTVGGSIYSDNAASRFLIINGQVFHEGNKITPDLVLEEIKLKVAVLSFKGQRFSMTF